jgi:hypothetical protein
MFVIPDHHRSLSKNPLGRYFLYGEVGAVLFLSIGVITDDSQGLY